MMADQLNTSPQRAIVMRLLITLAALLSLAAARTAQAQFGDFGLPGEQVVTAKLLSSQESLTPGSTATLAVSFDLEPDWHIYWKNSENVSTPTSVTWTLPEGYTVTGPAWPTPKVFVFDNLEQFGYEDQATLLFTVTAPDDAAGVATIKAKAEWLACKQSCIPGEAELSIELPIREEAPEASADADAIDKAAKKLPAQPDGWSYSAARTAGGYTLTVQAPSAEAAAALDGLYFMSDIKYAVDPAAEGPAS